MDRPYLSKTTKLFCKQLELIEKQGSPHNSVKVLNTLSNHNYGLKINTITQWRTVNVFFQ